jgi:hypothetical protein
MVNLFPDHFVLDPHHLLVSALLTKPVSMVGLVTGEVGVVFQSSNNAKDYIIRDHVLDDLRVVEQYESLHNCAESVQTSQILKILSLFHQGYHFVNVVVAKDKGSNRVFSRLGVE